MKSLTGYYLGREITEEDRIAMPIIERVIILQHVSNAEKALQEMNP